MKRFIILSIIVFAITIVNAANGFDVSFNQPSNDVYELNFNLREYSITEVSIEGENYSKIQFDGSVFTQLKGFAELPFISASLRLNDDKNVSLKIIEGEYEEFILAQPLLPSRGVIYRDEDPSTIPYEISPGSLRDNWYPQHLAINSSPFIIKDLRGTSVYVYPFRYNAVQNVLRVYKNITVQLIENETTPVNPLPVQATEILREMDGIYNSLFVNYQQSKDDLTIGEYGDIHVICTERDEEAIQPYIEWKMEKGFNVSIEVVETATNVKTNVQEAYDANNNLLYVQLVGDWPDIKCDLLSGYAPMDPQLGCVVGSDDVADITVGRISAGSANDVTIQVNKIINYEKNPEMGGTWYKGALGIGSNEGSGSGDDGEMDQVHLQVIWDDKLDPFTFDDYYTAYDPGASTTDVYNAIENGISIVNYTGHGYPQGWSTSGFSNNNVASLDNGNQLPWLVSVACNNGDFHGSGDCFGEAWMKKEGGGAIMFLGATISQPWQPPMRGQDYFMDILIGGYDYDAHPGQSGINTSEQRTTLGAIIFNGLALMTAESGSSSDWETAKTWHIFGDPSLQPRTDTPDDLSLSNNVILVGLDYTTTITGSNGPIEGAMVCLSQEGTYYKSVTDATGTISIPHTLTPGTAKLVVTAFNTETIYEDITVVPPGGAYVIVNACEVDDANGNNNGQADYGETVLLDVAVENVGSDIANGVDATITSSDPYISIGNNSYSYGDVEAGSIVEGNGAFEITIAEDAPDNHTAIIEVEFSDDSKTTWLGTMIITLHAPVIELGEYTISDTEGNNNGRIDPGETVEITVEILNTGSSAAYNIEGELSCADPFVSIETGNMSYGEISPEGSSEEIFTITADDNTPVGQMVTFEMLLVGDLNISASLTFDEVIGHIPVLIIDLEDGQNSGPQIQDAMADNGIVAEYTTAFPADLSLYSSLYICLGVYPGNHELSSSDGQLLADYLNNGGNLYMEGGETWYYDSPTAVHSMFSVNGTGDGGSDLGTINGMTGTATEGFSFNYSGDNQYVDRIAPQGSAVTVLENQSPSYATAVEYDADNYKTIAVSHEFGGLDDGANTKEELMGTYLNFFGFTNSLTALFSSSSTEICEGDVIEFYDMSNGNVLEWNWTFEGGSPGSSTFSDPMSMYMTAGTYDVTLTVSDGTDSNTITMEDYIVVNVCTEIKENKIDKISIYPNPNIGIFAVEMDKFSGENVSVKVLNSLSVVVFENNDITIEGNAKLDMDLSHLHKGLYFLVIENYQGSAVQRIIIR